MYTGSWPSPAVITALARFAGFVSMSVFASGGRNNAPSGSALCTVPPQPATKKTKKGAIRRMLQ